MGGASIVHFAMYATPKIADMAKSAMCAPPRLWKMCQGPETHPRVLRNIALKGAGSKATTCCNKGEKSGRRKGTEMVDIVVWVC